MCKYDGEREAALGSRRRRRRRRRRKKKNSPLLHKSIEWGQKPLGTKNAAGQKKKQKKRKKEREKTNTIAQVYDASSNTDARDINMKHALIAATTAASNDNDDEESSCCLPSPVLNVFSFSALLFPRKAPASLFRLTGPISVRKRSRRAH